MVGWIYLDVTTHRESRIGSLTRSVVISIVESGMNVLQHLRRQLVSLKLGDFTRATRSSSSSKAFKSGFLAFVGDPGGVSDFFP